MGCGSSTAVRPKEESEIVSEPIDNEFEDVETPLTDDEINSRIVCSTKPQYFQPRKGLKLEYAYLSQRGYYPDGMLIVHPCLTGVALNKPNQDSFRVVPNLAGNSQTIFFGVFDGHGSCGDLCSIYAKDKVPEMFAANLKKGMATKEAWYASFVDTNFMVQFWMPLTMYSLL